MLSQTDIPLAISLFIDGLDEFDGDYRALLKVLQAVQGLGVVKACLSSRALLAFQKGFAAWPTLKLQELTRDSIHQYVERQLEAMVEEGADRRACSLIDEIVNRGEGVYLWVVLAVRTLCSGLADLAAWNELRDAVFSLPSGIDNLYTGILERIPSYCRRDASRLMNILLAKRFNNGPVFYRGLTLGQLHLIEQDQSTLDEPISTELVAKNVWADECADLEQRIISHTRGFLTVTLDGYHRFRSASAGSKLRGHTASAQNFKSTDLYLSRLMKRVTVLHRTVIDFFSLNSVGQEFLHSVGGDTQMYLAISRGCFRFVVHCSKAGGTDLRLRFGAFDIGCILSSGSACVRKVELATGSPQTFFQGSFRPYFDIMTKIYPRLTVNQRYHLD